jgi:hypothetical protein
MAFVSGEGCYAFLYYSVNLVNNHQISITNTVSFHLFSVCKDTYFIRGVAGCRYPDDSLLSRSLQYERAEETVTSMTVHYRVLSKAVLK